MHDLGRRQACETLASRQSRTSVRRACQAENRKGESEHRGFERKIASPATALKRRSGIVRRLAASDSAARLASAVGERTSREAPCWACPARSIGSHGRASTGRRAGWIRYPQAWADRTTRSRQARHRRRCHSVPLRTMGPGGNLRRLALLALRPSQYGRNVPGGFVFCEPGRPRRERKG